MARRGQGLHLETSELITLTRIEEEIELRAIGGHLSREIEELLERLLNHADPVPDRHRNRIAFLEVLRG